MDHRNAMPRPAYLEQDDKGGTSGANSDATMRLPEHEDNGGADGDGDSDDTESITYSTADVDIKQFQGPAHVGATDDKDPKYALVPNGFIGNELTHQGDMFEYLVNRQYATSTDSIETVVQKNLIVALQAHVLAEDCLVKQDSENARAHKKRRSRVYQRLQQAVGLPRGAGAGAFIRMLDAYARARDQEIVRSVVKLAKEPQLPNSPLNAVLIALMDRFLVFNATRQPIYKRPLSVPFDIRLEAHCTTIHSSLEDVIRIARERVLMVFGSMELGDIAEMQTAPAALWTRPAQMLPSDEINWSFDKPWLMEEWSRYRVPKDASTKVDQPKPSAGQKPLSAATESSAAVVGTEPSWYTERWFQKLEGWRRKYAHKGAWPRNSTMVNRPEPPSVQEYNSAATQPATTVGTESSPAETKHQAETFNGNKRKREDQDEEDCEEDRPKPTKSRVVETVYYTTGTLVYRPKKA